MRWPRITFVLALASGLAIVRPIAGAASSIEQVVPRNLTPDPGSVANFQIAITPADNTAWEAGSYTVTLIAADPTGATVASAPPLAADEPAVPQATTMVFAALQLPPDFVGPLNVRAHLVHGGASEDSVPVAIVVGGTPGAANAAPSPSPALGQPRTQGSEAVPGPSPAPAFPAPATPKPSVNINGTLALNAGFAAQQTESGGLNLSSKLTNSDSVTAVGSLANTTSNTKPIATFQSPSVLMRFGTFSPSLERDAFSGPTGTGVGFKTSWDNSLQTLQGVYLSGNHDTTSPYQMEALSYQFPALRSALTLTAGYENIYGPAQPGPYFLRNGAFFGLGDDIRSPHSSFSYGVHYGITLFHDDLSGTEQLGEVLELPLSFTIRRAQFAFDYLRTSPFFANASAPAVTPDRESGTAAISIPLGAVQVSLGANVYRDDLPGSTLLQTTHFATENLGIAVPLKNGDLLSLQAVNGVQHQTGAPIAPFGGNDGTTFSYTTKRGPYVLELTLQDTETRDNTGDLVHVITDGLTISRSPFAGITFSGAINLSRNDASAATATTLSNSATASLSYTPASGFFTLSTQVNHSLTHPYAGLSPPPTTTYNYGLSLKPRGWPYSMSLTVTENVGSSNFSVGAFSLNRQF